MFGGSAKAEEASSLYTKAANAYKMSKDWTAAGKSFTEAAKLQLHRVKSKHEAARLYGEAANCYRKEDARGAINCLESSNGIYNDMGKFNFVAKNNVTIAELYESKELQDYSKAMEHYTAAAEFYKTEQSSGSTNKCLVKVAQYSAQQEQYEQAATIYEEVATACLDNSLTKYSAQGYLFRAGLCRMCGSFPNSVQPHMDRYSDICPPFETSRESKFLHKLAGALDERSDVQFVTAIDEYNRSVKLDEWFKTMLTRLLDKAFPKQNLLASDKNASPSSSSWASMLGRSLFRKTDQGKSKSPCPSSSNSQTAPASGGKAGKSVSSFFSKSEKTTKKVNKNNTSKSAGNILASKQSKRSPAVEEKSGINPFDLDDDEDEVATNPFHDDQDDPGDVSTNPFEEDDDEASLDRQEGKKEKNLNPFDDEDEEMGTNPFEDGDLR